jgi:hypothetical protein
MANNKIQLKRTAITGRTPNTTNSGNTSFIDAGELAVNLTDRKVFSSNGTASFEVGSNLTSLSVNTIVASGATGTSGQVLTSNGTASYWSTPTTGESGNVAVKSFTYTITSNTSIITGADDFSEVLSYTAGFENVFINGIKVIGGVDYTTSNAAAITLASNVESGEVVQVLALNPLTSFVETYANTATISSTNAFVVDSFSKTTYRTAKYLVSITSNSQYHGSEVLVLHDGTTAFSTEYATIFSNNSLAVISANLNNANVELIVTPTYTAGTVQIKRITLGI